MLCWKLVWFVFVVCCLVIAIGICSLQHTSQKLISTHFFDILCRMLLNFWGYEQNFKGKKKTFEVKISKFVQWTFFDTEKSQTSFFSKLLQIKAFIVTIKMRYNLVRPCPCLNLLNLIRGGNYSLIFRRFLTRLAYFLVLA